MILLYFIAISFWYFVLSVDVVIFRYFSHFMHIHYFYFSVPFTLFLLYISSPSLITIYRYNYFIIGINILVMPNHQINNTRNTLEFCFRFNPLNQIGKYSNIAIFTNVGYFCEKIQISVTLLF